MTLRDEIVAVIRHEGPIHFSRYMSLCLYHPEFGYYSRPEEKFGKTGDFYTSSDVHAVFGRLLARQFEEMWRVLKSPAAIDIIELGPGRGLFAQDVLDWCRKRFPDFAGAMRYRMVESSPSLRGRLQRRFSRYGDKAQVFSGMDEAEQGIAGPLIVFANEFFDALPVDVIAHDGEVLVSESNGTFTETTAPAGSVALEYLDRYGAHPESGERVEVAPISKDWMTRIAHLLSSRRGFAVIVDYGYTREELLAGRHRGTVMTYQRHRASTNPYQAPGEQDITAHVNFTALRSGAHECGVEPLALLTQSQFLLGIGQQNELADAFEECKLPQERAKVILQLKHLITPAGMGESFQVMLLASGVAKEEAARLSGLSFGR